MRAEEWRTWERELEGWPVNVTYYRVGCSCVTQIESSLSGAVIARGIAATRKDSEQQAFETARERLLQTRRIELTVGG